MALEGTGSLVLDRYNRTAYVALSKRADKNLAEAGLKGRDGTWWQQFGPGKCICDINSRIENIKFQCKERPREPVANVAATPVGLGERDGL